MKETTKIMPKLNIGCWNIGSLLQNQQQNTDIVTDTIHRFKPDILCLQEFPSSDALLAQIKASGDFTHHIFIETSSTHVCDGWNMGLCVLSKTPLDTPEILPLPIPVDRIWYNGKEEFWHPKYFLQTAINLDGQPIKIITGHGFPFYRYGLQELDYAYIYRTIDNWLQPLLAEHPYLIAADFNAYDPIQFMPFVQSDHYDVFSGIPTRPTGRKTDGRKSP
jgi:exonuclease III